MFKMDIYAKSLFKLLFGQLLTAGGIGTFTDPKSTRCRFEATSFKKFFEEDPQLETSRFKVFFFTGLLSFFAELQSVQKSLKIFWNFFGPLIFVNSVYTSKFPQISVTWCAKSNSQVVKNTKSTSKKYFFKSFFIL